MKKVLPLVAILLCFSFTPTEIPPTNQKVIEYVNTVIGKKVGRGECWDLADAALTYAHAKWTSPFGFGKLVDYRKGEFVPGDIIHIQNVTMESRTETSLMRWKMVEHTAIVYEVTGDGKLKVAEQNLNKMKKVVISDWNLADVKGGKLEFFRPQP